ncbi:MAG: mannose-1-phosphate guanylyltransferase/mannose-6-phosphate isomerase [Polynucleobacter sp. 24-46-87]|jgi:mannose-1-phosphate guanylyltransferase/mannose-6-phosphate isomerase|nr:MAG: mannose-1-phosphate guanylyltransferase/mannose-6-phosphate isomerase [Polynucleobacter sp. 35-46-207]OZA13180.1 MAG: mannose-1-phosphate guanylyltransferase/mannose-6-phosphate isomerase [Polynucleobacter sp. 24-46-87]OZB48689.1 MAG: mannose-1-phosphate guanylyltransferase/mannose-6-phosphate isomerase [Polynucleobacter sp. 39-45-136]
MAKAGSATLVIPVILCGGSGARLWPLSRSGFPKQFLVLSGDGSGRSLFQQAIERVNALGESHSGEFTADNIELGNTIIVTNEEHRFLALDQLREMPNIKATLLLEPLGRNTAPALTLAALQAKDGDCTEDGKVSSENIDPILVITPADQTIQNQAAFLKAVRDCIAVVNADQSKNTIAILGITPTAPETGYGYIKRQGSKGTHQEYAVERFVEKPDEKIAAGYLAEGDYLWNSGMFVMHASTWLASLKEFRPDIYGAAETAWIASAVDQAVTAEGNVSFLRPDKAIFKTIPSESIDYAVIEKCPQSHFPIKMVELNAGWNDLGAWDAVWQVGKQDENGNVTTGDVILSNSRNSLIYSSGRLVSAVGVDNLIIIETADAVLVTERKNSQDVKSIVSQLEHEKREEKNLHRKVARPWGWYDSVDEGERFKVKRIQVKPGASLSLQMHHHRAEHWVVVKGIAEITNGDQVITLTENQSTYIPQGQTHRLTNPGKMPLEIIEVQSGSYLGEDDIVRYEDAYGRS